MVRTEAELVVQANSDDMRDRYIRKFRVEVDTISGRWHVGIFFCSDFKNILGKRDKYVFICLGHKEISIGMITRCKE